jgi:hypothetical protein
LRPLPWGVSERGLRVMAESVSEVIGKAQAHQ